MEVQRVFLDANILFSRTLRDWIFLLRNETQGRMFTVATSEDAIVEAQNSFRKQNPEAPGRNVSHLRRKIVESCDEVLEDYPGKTKGPILDKYDYHIHSASTAAGSHILLTQDRDFLDLPENDKDELQYEIMSPDEFFVLIDDSASQFVSAVTKIQNTYWLQKKSQSNTSPNMSLETALRKSGCPEFALRVRKHLKNLSGAH